MFGCKKTISKYIMLNYLRNSHSSKSITVTYKKVVTNHCVIFEYQCPTACRTVTFNGTLPAFATAVAVGRSANSRILRFIPMATAHPAGHESLYGGIEICSRRLQGRAPNSEAIV